MKYSGAVEQACCIMGILAHAATTGAQVTNETLSDRLDVSPSYLKKITRKLVEANIIISSHGTGGGFHLAKNPRDITLLDIVLAIEGNQPLFRPTGLLERVFKRRDIVEIGLSQIETTFRASEDAAKQNLRTLTLAKLITEIKEQHHVSH